jgi:glycosyltransferase involved in cell wall biosynthesis
MKILQINCVYKKGSTGKIVYDLHTEFQKRGIGSVICYGRGQKSSEPNVYKTSGELAAKFNALKSRITGLQYNGSLTATNKLIKIIKKENPDIVHLHCINGNFVNIYRLLGFLKISRIKTMLTLHAEFMYTGGCAHAFDCGKWTEPEGCSKCPDLWSATKSYFFDRTQVAWKKMNKAFNGFNVYITAVSPWLEERAKKSPMLAGKSISAVFNGIDTENLFYPREFAYLKERHGLGSDKIILHVTANFGSAIKGGKYFLELAGRMRGKNILFIIVGNKGGNLKLPGNIIDAGEVKDPRELAAYYSMADVTVLTSSRETFSMVCAESLSCGTPVVGFKAGAPELISLAEYSEFVDQGDMDSLENAVEKWIYKKNEISSFLASAAKEFYSKGRMCEGYLAGYDKLISGRFC